MRLFFYFILIAGSVTAQGQPLPENLPHIIDKLTADYRAKRTNVGLVIGLSWNGQRYVTGFGRKNKTDTNAPDGKTIFEIGSITKVFTGILLAQMVEEGKLSLSNTVSEVLKEKAQLPKAAANITLQHLATHSSGLPRLGPNWREPKGWDRNDPYASYAAEHLYKSLALAKTNTRPGDKYAYSNFGYGTLAHILELKSGMSYREFVQKRICDPLGLRDTTIELSPAQKSRLAPGHDAAGRPVTNWHFQVMAGAGALRSTVDDMLLFLEANLHPEKTKPELALAKAQKTYFNAGGVEAGLGWAISRRGGSKILWHNGGTGGYISFAGIDLTHTNGVVVLSNYGDALVDDFSTDKIAMQLLKSMGEKQ